MKGSGTGGMRVLDMERIEVLLVEDRDPLHRPSILIAYDFWFFDFLILKNTLLSGGSRKEICCLPIKKT